MGYSKYSLNPSLKIKAFRLISSTLQSVWSKVVTLVPELLVKVLYLVPIAHMVPYWWRPSKAHQVARFRCWNFRQVDYPRQNVMQVLQFPAKKCIRQNIYCKLFHNFKARQKTNFKCSNGLFATQIWRSFPKIIWNLKKKFSDASVDGCLKATMKRQ